MRARVCARGRPQNNYLPVPGTCSSRLPVLRDYVEGPVQGVLELRAGGFDLAILAGLALAEGLELAHHPIGIPRRGVCPEVRSEPLHPDVAVAGVGVAEHYVLPRGLFERMECAPPARLIRHVYLALSSSAEVIIGEVKGAVGRLNSAVVLPEEVDQPNRPRHVGPLQRRTGPRLRGQLERELCRGAARGPQRIQLDPVAIVKVQVNERVSPRP